ncbi:DUF7701 domain-containing protein [Streptomyces guryensis]|uniref:DUF7701 domain-containing protein n=1 Tax=Streptomyces guryensis TaxID=2886947 RepID=A0A9Q3VPI5_9ACTN|nr:hypothetical protein [Streptomyces guryensis]MCD9876106.1 hypothetical protein [Streptomyces guryensis]
MSYLSADAGLIRELLPPQARPAEDSDGLFLLYAVLMRAKGEQVTAADVHDAWTAWMQLRNPDHAALVPFDELSPVTRREDEPYAQAIQAAARVRSKDRS